jgi:hypothetical protein
MKSDFIEELLLYRSGCSKSGNLTSFFAIESEQITQLEHDTGITLPPHFRKFYELIGHGSIQRGRNGVCADYDLNIIVDPERLKSFVLRTEPTFLVDETIFEEGDLPFFDMGSYSYLVMRINSKKPDAIYWPYDRAVVSENIWEFVDRLLENPRFYHNVLHNFVSG